MLNVAGVRESTTLNGVVSAIDVVSETSILFFGFLFAFSPDLLIHSMTAYWPGTDHLLLGTSLAIISFVGLESISQAAQETQRPASVIPRTSISLILTILVYALAYSNLALGMTPAHPVPLDAERSYADVLPVFGHRAKTAAARSPFWPRTSPTSAGSPDLYVPILGAILLLISSNSGVFGASRIAYAMSKSRICCPRPSSACTTSTARPPCRSSPSADLACVVLIFAALPSLDPSAQSIYGRFFHGEAGIDVLADLYAFGAATSYSFVFIALIALRLRDPLSPRKFTHSAQYPDDVPR